MTKHANSIRKKQQKASKLEEEWTLRAAQIYQEGQGSSSSPAPSLQRALEKAQEEYVAQTGKVIKLNKSRVHRRVHGGKSRQEAADDRSWLTPEETKIVVDFTIEYSDRGFPLSHRRLKEHVDQILRARLGDKFPAEGVGKQWTTRFVSDNERLHMYWSRALDRSRARAVNPTTKAEYFDLLEQITEGEGGDDKIPPFFTRSAVDSLSGSSASFLTSMSPLKATSMPPLFKPVTISPQRPISRYAELLARPAMNAYEQELRDALAECDQRDEARKAAMIGMQAGVVLAGMYVNRAQNQLQEAEERKGKKKSRRKMGDGKAKWFTSDAFIQLCIDDDQRREEEERGKEGRQVARETRAAELAEWKKKNDLIRARNEAKKELFEADKAAWELEKAEAKADKRRPAWQKPKWKDYNPEPLLPRPKKLEEGGDEKDDSDGEGSGNGSGMGED